MQESLIVLGLESSCDDTAAAVVSHSAGELAKIHSSIVHGQVGLHSEFGGVVPEIAARAHASRLDHCTEIALAEAGIKLREIDAIAVTSGPGLIGGLLAGVSFAKGLSAGSGKPILGINHLAGHALTAVMTHGIEFPYLGLLVSGGHCQFLAVMGADKFIRLGGTIDDAPGEAFDKSARLLGLEQPGGPAVERSAKSGDQNRFSFPRPLAGRDGCNMSFSGLKTALLRARNSLAAANGTLESGDIADLCAGFQVAVRDVLAERSHQAFGAFQARVGDRAEVFAVSGGVAANKEIRSALENVSRQNNAEFVAPEPKYCTDNAAMIALAGILRFRLGLLDDMGLQARPRWPLDATSPPLTGSGKKGVKS